MLRIKPRPPLPSTAFTLPARFYTDPGLFAREQEIFFRGMWMSVGRLEDIFTLLQVHKPPVESAKMAVGNINYVGSSWTARLPRRWPVATSSFAHAEHSSHAR